MVLKGQERKGLGHVSVFISLTLTLELLIWSYDSVVFALLKWFHMAWIIINTDDLWCLIMGKIVCSMWLYQKLLYQYSTYIDFFHFAPKSKSKMCLRSWSKCLVCCVNVLKIDGVRLIIQEHITVCFLQQGACTAKLALATQIPTHWPVNTSSTV